MLGPLTRIEKSLLQAHFRSVNYCQYNFVEHRTLIYVPACNNFLREVNIYDYPIIKDSYQFFK
ncbi:hypothetical protein B9Y28_09265 [Staphylococcus aureus]|nr:hypothetical protein B9Y46_01325 [Staphylococcus aureus]PSN04610.1 hypothetical protein B9Y28_09265 [Staphylococcus aureus]PTY45373.1 hypothetical protein B1T33_10360 [Staphylococcus aureus]PTY48283.1 hypothetical protein B1T34_12415 [Staphylococcus aureus]